MQFSPPDLVEVEAERQKYKSAGLAAHTVQAYESDLRVFNAWCEAAGREAVPATPDTVELYVCDLLRRGRKVSTLERHAAGIQHYHRAAGYESPCGPQLRALLCGARRVLCQAPAQKEAISLDELRAIVRVTGTRTPIAARNCALLVFGFASALRRSNLAALRLEDLTFSTKGILVWIAHEKQDREGIGRWVAVPRGKHRNTCPVTAIERWLRYRGDEPGPLFRRVRNGRVGAKGIQPNRIGQIVQESVARIGLDPKRYSAHSLRAGLATEALTDGVGEILVARQTGHHSLETLRRYLRSRDLFRGNASGKIGL